MLKKKKTTVKKACKPVKRKKGAWSLFGKKNKTKFTSWNKGWSKSKSDAYTKSLRKKGYKNIKVKYDNKLGGYIHTYEL